MTFDTFKIECLSTPESLETGISRSFTPLDPA